jgi:hypothetical protein
MNFNPDYALEIYYKQFLLQNLALTHFLDLIYNICFHSKKLREHQILLYKSFS